MEILKIAINWAKTEVFSSSFFILFGIMFVLGSIGFWQFGKTEMLKAYIIPLLVGGVLLLIIGSGLIYNDSTRITNFSNEYDKNPSAFVESEIERSEKTLSSSKTTVFKIIPIIIIVCALILIFIDNNTWQASMITIIAFMSILLFIDSMAIARLENYVQQLLLVKK